MRKEDHKNIYIEEPICKNCGKQFTQTGKGRHRTFCSDRCCKLWWKNNKRKDGRGKPGRRPVSGNVRIRPVFRKDPDVGRLSRAIIAKILQKELDDEGMELK